MGSICYIQTVPSEWTAWQAGLRLVDSLGGEDLVRVRFGSFDDETLSDMEMYMRQSIFDKVMSGEYRVSPNSKWKKKLVLIDKHGNEVAPINECIY